ncbi:MAG: glycosyltransferase family 39 protein [Halobacteriota archaeon]
MLAIVIIGLFLRVYCLGASNLFVDEAVSIYIAKLSLSQLLQTQAQLDLNPPLYAFVLHYWMVLFGDSEFSVRFLSVVFGTLAIPMTFVVGRQLFDEEVGLLGALILAVSSFNVQFSQTARMYSLMLLLALLSMYFFLSFLRRNTLSISVGYVLATTLLLYTHVYGVFVLLAQNIYLIGLFLLATEKIVRLRQWIVLQAIVVGLFAAWIPVLVSHITVVQSGFWVPPPAFSTFLDTFVLYSGGRVLLILLFVLAIFSLFTRKKVNGSADWKPRLQLFKNHLRNVHLTNKEQVTFLLVWLLAVTALPFVVSHFSTSFYVQRYTIAASVALYLLAASGLRKINWSYAKVAVIAVIIVLSAVNLQQYYSQVTTQVINGQPQDAFNLVDKNVKSGDVVILFPGYTKFIWDYYETGTNVNATPFLSVEYYSMSWTFKNTDIKELQSDVKGHDRVWFVSPPEGPSSIYYPLYDQALKTLNESYKSTYSASYLGYDVRLFESRS